jgi:hypothetical protein
LTILYNKTGINFKHIISTDTGLRDLYRTIIPQVWPGKRLRAENIFQKIADIFIARLKTPGR